VVAPTALAYPLQALGLQQGAGQMNQASLPHSGPAPLQLPTAQPMLRELNAGEVAALLTGATPCSRFAIALLLSGISPEELLALTWENVNTETMTIRITSPAVREFPLTDELVAIASESRSGQSGQAPLIAAQGQASPTSDDLDVLVATACHDGGLAQAVDVTPAALRHTCLAFMARQGLRFAELARIAGPLPASVITAYGALAPDGVRRSIAEVERVHSGLKVWVGQMKSAEGNAHG
jgi:integrase